jgi:hypothetical protein
MRTRRVVLLACALLAGTPAGGCARRDPSVLYAQPESARGPASAASTAVPAAVTEPRARGSAPPAAVPTAGVPTARSVVGYPVAPAPVASEVRSAGYARPVCVGAADAGGRLRVTAALEMRVGNPRGHIQIPKGGQPGTTSPGRPTFEEVGVDTAWAPALDVTLALRRHRLHVGAVYWLLHGEETLRQALTSHEDFYPAGTAVESSSAVGESYLSYGYAFDLSRAVTVTPALGVYGHRIAYEIAGGGNTSTRDFSAYSPMFETEVLWRPGGRMHVTAHLRLVLDDVLGLESPTNVVDAQVRWHWDLWSRGSLHLATGVTSISHHDEQPVPNEILLEVLPWFGFGGELRF